MKQSGRQIGKLSHSNPTILFDYVSVFYLRLILNYINIQQRQTHFKLDQIQQVAPYSLRTLIVFAGSLMAAMQTYTVAPVQGIAYT